MNKKAFIFPGQGAQRPFMGKSFYDAHLEAREVHQQAEDLLNMHITEKIFSTDEESLKQTDFCQVALFVTSMAILKVLQVQAPEFSPFVTAGLSLGEYGAILAAKKGRFEEILKIIKLRGLFMNEASKVIEQGMVAVFGLEEKDIAKKYQIANVNTPGQIVIAGSKNEMRNAEIELKAKGAKRVVPLNVSGAFHSSYMDIAREKLTPFIMECNLVPTEVQFVMNLTGKKEMKGEKIKQNLIDQISTKTRWLDCLQTMEEMDVDYIEIGPSQLSTMNKRMRLKGATFCIQEVKDIEALYEKV